MGNKPEENSSLRSRFAEENASRFARTMGKVFKLADEKGYELPWKVKIRDATGVLVQKYSFEIDEKGECKFDLADGHNKPVLFPVTVSIVDGTGKMLEAKISKEEELLH